jgi:hypothetical protein
LVVMTVLCGGRSLRHFWLGQAFCRM